MPPSPASADKDLSEKDLEEPNSSIDAGGGGTTDATADLFGNVEKEMESNLGDFMLHSRSSILPKKKRILKAQGPLIPMMILILVPCYSYRPLLRENPKES